MNKKIFFLASDASFRPDNTAIMAVKDFYDNKHYQKIVKGLNGSLAAEEQALRFAIDIAITKEYKHVVFIYDCHAIKTEKFIARYGKNFQTIQFLWMPREHISSVDILTKKHFSDSEIVIMNKSEKDRDSIIYDAFSQIDLSDKESFFINLLSDKHNTAYALKSDRTIILSTLYILLSNTEKKRMKRYLNKYLTSQELNKVFKRKGKHDYLAAINFYKIPKKEELIDILKVSKIL